MIEKKVTRIAPSDISFTANCGHCLWHKYHTGWKNESIFPSVFSLLDINQKNYFCIVNFGPKPTFNDYRQSLEAHILDFNENIYDQILSVEFLCKIRDQIKFNSIDDLKNQIQKDKEKAESLLKDYEQ